MNRAKDMIMPALRLQDLPGGNQDKVKQYLSAAIFFTTPARFSNIQHIENMILDHKSLNLVL